MGILPASGLLLALAVAGCGPNYAADTYSRQAVQQANKVDQGEVVGWREITISADGTVGFVTGSAAGGIAGSQAAGGVGSAFGALGGGLLGGLVGGAVEQGTGDVKAFEYVVRKPDGELMSVVQRDRRPLGIGRRVLLISDAQARIVPDYTVSTVAAAPPPVALAATPGRNRVHGTDATTGRVGPARAYPVATARGWRRSAPSWPRPANPATPAGR